MKICRRSPRGNVDWNTLYEADAGGSFVVPHEGTWIEIVLSSQTYQVVQVVPHEGTWIEMPRSRMSWRSLRSFPTRERGLKLPSSVEQIHRLRRSPRGNVDWNNLMRLVLAKHCVVPHEGTWIEICFVLWSIFLNCRRSPRGNVDWNKSTPVSMEVQAVVPHEGTWIEIACCHCLASACSSFPTRERGLK